MTKQESPRDEVRNDPEHQQGEIIALLGTIHSIVRHLPEPIRLDILDYLSTSLDMARAEARLVPDSTGTRSPNLVLGLQEALRELVRGEESATDS